MKQNKGKQGCRIAISQQKLLKLMFQITVDEVIGELLMGTSFG